MPALMRRPRLLQSLVPTLVLAVCAPLQAQEGGRMQVLVPHFTAPPRSNAGQSLAEAVRRQLDGMRTHMSVPANVYRDALRRFNLREQDIDCITGLQLANQMRVPLIMCGTVEPVAEGVRISVEVISTQNGEKFTLEPFVAPNPARAAEHVAQSFATYAAFDAAANYCAVYLGSEQWENALSNCERALELNPTADVARYHRAFALYQLERYAEALTALEQVLDSNPIHQDALLTAGLAALRLEDSQRAMRYFRAYLDLDPGNVLVRIRVARDLNTEGNAEAALILAEEGLRHAPDDLTLVEYAGHFALNAARRLLPARAGGPVAADDDAARPFLETSLRYYQQVFAAKGEESPPLMLRNTINALMLLERDTEAAGFGRRAVAAVPDDPELWLAFADALQRTGSVDEALTALARVLELQPETPRLQYRRADLLLKSDRLDEAVTAFRTAIARGEISYDEASNAIFVYAYREKYNVTPRQADAAYRIMAAARELAESPQVRGAPAFYMGEIDYRRGEAASGTSGTETAASAQRALPLFQRARASFQESAPWIATQSAGLQNSLRQFLNGSDQYIELQEAVIRQRR